MFLSWKIVKLNLKETFAIAYGNYSFREALIIKLEKNNYSGFGECTAIDYYQINLLDFIKKLDEIKSQIENHKIIHPKEFYQFLATLNVSPFLLSALDCAYWDLFGKLENKSFFELNNFQFESVPESSITISVAPIEEQIQKIKNSDWNKFKVKCNHFDKAAIESLSKLDKTISFDANGTFTKEECYWLENNQNSNDFLYIEQPMKVGFENYKNLSITGNANWMADEDFQKDCKLEDLKPHYESINIKLVKCGGISPALDLISQAKQLGFKTMIGCMTESTVGISAGAVLAPFCDFADLDGANLIANDIANGSKVVNGKIRLIDKPGLGIELI